MLSPVHVSEKHYLGPLCKREHDHQDTGQSLRYLSCRACVACRAITSQTLAATPAGRASQQAAQARYAQSPQCRAWLKDYRQTPQGKQVISNAQLRYRKTPNGQKVRRKAEKKYAVTEKRRVSYRREYARRRALIKEQHEHYSVEQIQILLEHFEGRCAYCGSARNLTLDHVKVLQKGGADAIGNLVPACRSCNSSKQASDVQEWYEQRTSYSAERWDRVTEYMR